MAKLDYQTLTDYQQSLDKGIKRRQKKLNATKEALNTIANSLNFSGQTATNVSNYIKEVHVNGIIEQLNQALVNFQIAMNFYVISYPSVDDEGVLFELVDKDFTNSKQEVKTAKGNYEKSIKSAKKTMANVSDIVETSGSTSLKKAGKNLNEALSQMHKIATNQQSGWHELESKHENDFSDTQEIVDKVNQLVGQYQGGKMPTMENYTTGLFSQNLGVKYNDKLKQIQQYNSRNKKVSQQAGKQIKEINHQQHVYEKKVKKARIEKNKRDGWKEFGTDALVAVAGITITIASGGFAAPIVLLVPEGLFTVAKLGEDLNKATTGKKEGFNFLKKGTRFVGKSTGLSTEDSDSIYSSLEFVANIAGSAGAYKDLVKAGYFVEGEKTGKSILATFMKEDANAAKNVFYDNVHLFKESRGATNGFLPEVNNSTILNPNRASNIAIYRTLGNAYGKVAIKNKVKKRTDLFLSKQVNDPIIKEYEIQTKGHDGNTVRPNFIKNQLNMSETKVFNFSYGKAEQIIFVEPATE
ncbi:T7SS effector LXG polymorphic toxin [Ligilactobacillus acidipiscis]|uniref:T7SS effector LXG polymorphic toxin n=1 Tax=Ligilactobacillus acidipiscis TaxID=89059 RepID=UPI0023F67EE0|nr:T7SS effector LXG polymorphic toxin [Ligilactobacillus acidipiscis]WEV56414.1 T7SS effector LXG polymorphic toxin [Ligilactobacillus acidipiscis]